MNVPQNLKFTADHEWVRAEGNRAWIGITDYAQDALGDVVFVQLPQVGTNAAVSESIGEVESTKSVSDIYAPISGPVVEVNGDLERSPELLNQDPYGSGWICCIEITDPAQVEGLMDAEAYSGLIGE